MKRISAIILLMSFIGGGAKAQTIYYEAPLYDNSTSTARGPNGASAHVYMRACALVKATELSNIASSTTITSFGFTLNSGAVTNAAVGNFSLYLQNTTDVTYNKGTTFSTAIAPMTLVFANTMTVPISSTSTSITITLSTPFVYTGGGVYVAYDWYNPGPYSTTAAVYRCNSGGLSPGLASAANTSSAPATLATTAFRPCFLWGVINTYTNEIAVTGLDAPGRVAGTLGTSHTITAIVKNNSNITKNNIPVTLSVGGANTYVNTQTITSLASLATTTVTFSSFAPGFSGLNTITVSVPADEENLNNQRVYTQSVTCNEWALNPAAVSYTMGSVGFNTGSGIIASQYESQVASALMGLRGAISTNTPSIGNQSWGVLLSSTGSVLATTNTITLTSGMMGSFQTYTFSTPPVLATTTTYYIGFAQPANSTGYFPAGTFTSGYVPFYKYVTTTTVGGAVAPLTSNLGYFGIEAIFAPTVVTSVSSATITCGGTATLAATAAGTYTWGTSGPSNTTLGVAPVSSSIYTVFASNAFGCADSRTTLVTVNPITVTAMASQVAACAGSSIVLTASGAGSYSWTNPGGFSVSFSLTPAAGVHIYSVNGAGAPGCLGSGSVMVTINPRPVISVSSQTVVCGDTTVLGATVNISSGTASYSWTSGPINADYTVTPNAATVYSVDAISNAGCVSSATVAVAVNPLTVTAIAASSAICLGDTVTISAAGAASYTWNTGGSINSQVFTDSPLTTTIYSVQADNPAGCTGDASVTVVVNSFTSLGVSSSSLVTCAGQTVSATGTGATIYNWDTGSSTFSTAVITQTPAAGGIYTLTGTDANGCVATLDVTVTVHPNPVVTTTVTRAGVMCTGESNTLTAGGAVNYVWNGSSTGNFMVITPTIAGTQTYTVVGTNSNSCSASTTATVQVSDCVGLSEKVPGNQIKVFPNPFHAEITVIIENANQYTVLKVFNMLGEVVSLMNAPEKSTRLNLESKANGIYFIQVLENGKPLETIRVIKQ